MAAFVGLLVLSLYGGTAAVFAAAWLALGVLGIWIATYAQMHQLRLLGEERLALADLERERREKLGGTKTIFDETDMSQMEALSMGRRLRSMERWFIPICGLIVAGYNAFFGLRLIGVKWFWPFLPFEIIASPPEVSSDKMPVVAGFAAFIAFLAFLLSRWGIVLARVREFQQGRAGGNAMFGVVLATIAAVMALLATNAFGAARLDLWVAQAIGILMLILAIETVLNFVLDFYRPRVPGMVARSFFDSRLLGMFSEPGGILKSLANAVDYQFGFKVSETWFYQLLGRWIVPLLLVQAMVLWLVTGMVVVPQGFEAVVERFGMDAASSTVSVLKPGISFGLPWPLTRSTLIATDRIQRFEIGYDRLKESTRQPGEHAPELWTTKHRESEYVLLVPDKNAAADASLPLNLLSMTIPVQWRVKPGATRAFHANADDAPAIIEQQAYRILTAFAGRADVVDLLGRGGSQAADTIHAELQAALDHAGLQADGRPGGDLGVDIVQVGLANVHPTTTAAESYEEVVNAFQRKQASILAARGDAHRQSVIAGGLKFQSLYDAIVEEEKAAGQAGEAKQHATRRVEQMLQADAGGEARQIVADAEQRAYTRVMNESSKATLFTTQMAAYRESPELYKLRRHLATLERGIAGVRKYILALRDNSRVLVILDEGSAVPPGLIKSTLEGLKEAN